MDDDKRDLAREARLIVVRFLSSGRRLWPISRSIEFLLTGRPIIGGLSESFKFSLNWEVSPGLAPWVNCDPWLRLTGLRRPLSSGSF